MPPYQGMVKPLRHRLHIRDFFEYFDEGCPYHLAALSHLEDQILKADPSILDSESEWFVIWSTSPKRVATRK